MSQSGWFVYLLRCSDGTLYCGCTNDVDARLAAHGRGRVKYTRGRLPVALVYREGARDRSAALKRELAIKALTRREKLVLVNGLTIGRRAFPSRKRTT